MRSQDISERTGQLFFPGSFINFHDKQNIKSSPRKDTREPATPTLLKFKIKKADSLGYKLLMHNKNQC